MYGWRSPPCEELYSKVENLRAKLSKGWEMGEKTKMGGKVRGQREMTAQERNAWPARVETHQ